MSQADGSVLADMRFRHKAAQRVHTLCHSANTYIFTHTVFSVHYVVKRNFSCISVKKSAVCTDEDIFDMLAPPFLFLPEPKSHRPCTYVHWGSRAHFVKDALALLFIPKYLSNGLVHTPRQRQRWIRAILPGSLDFFPASRTRYTFQRAPYFTLWLRVPSETTTPQPRPLFLIINTSPCLRHLCALPICPCTPACMSTLYLLLAHYSVTATPLALLLPYTYHILLDPTLTGSFPSCGICFSF